MNIAELLEDKMNSDIQEAERFMQDQELVSYRDQRREQLQSFITLFCEQHEIDSDGYWFDSAASEWVIELREITTQGDLLRVDVFIAFKLACDITSDMYSVDITMKRVVYDEDRSFVIDLSESSYSCQSVLVNNKVILFNGVRELDLDIVLLRMYLSYAAEDYVL